jgi:hypothetical protein
LQASQKKEGTLTTRSIVLHALIVLVGFANVVAQFLFF